MGSFDEVSNSPVGVESHDLEMSQYSGGIVSFSVKRIVLVASLVLLALAALLMTRNLIDFPVYYSAGQSLLAGRSDLYAPDFARGPVMDYRYPPFFLIVLVPLWLLPYRVASLLWQAGAILEIAGCGWVLSSLTDEVGRKARFWAVAGLIVAQYFVMILHYGNAHLLAVLLMFGASYCVIVGRDFRGAFLMSLSITVKLVPAMLLPYFALRKKWKFLALTCLLVAVLNLAPAAYFGFSKNIELLRAWFSHVVVNQEFHEANGPINLSLKGQLARYLTDVDYSQRVDGDVGYPAVNIVAIPPSKAEELWIALAALSVLSGFFLFLQRTRRVEAAPLANGSDPADVHQNGGSRFMFLEIGLVICLMLLVGPLVSKIYFIALLWPTIAAAALAFNRTDTAGRLAKAALIVAAITNSVLPLLPGRSIQRLLLVVGVDFYVNLLVTVVASLLLLASLRIPPGQFGERRTGAP